MGILEVDGELDGRMPRVAIGWNGPPWVGLRMYSVAVATGSERCNYHARPRGTSCTLNTHFIP